MYRGRSVCGVDAGVDDVGKRTKGRSFLRRRERHENEQSRTDRDKVPTVAKTREKGC